MAQITEPGLYADGAGLYLQVTKSRTSVIRRSWVARLRLPGGQVRDMGLGSADGVTLSEIRETAAKARLEAKQGHDPINARREARRALARRLKAEQARAITFRHCADAYIAAHEATWRNPKHALQWPVSLKTYVHPVIGNLPVGEVDNARVIAVLEPIWAKKPETASRIRGRIEMILDWARVRGYREGENPARWKGNLSFVFPSRARIRPPTRFAALPYEDMHAFWAALEALEGKSAAALRFCILTAARTGEVLGARWDEIDLKKGVWTIPVARMKGGREHRVPLSPEALDVLNLVEAPNREGVVFSGARGRPLSGMSLLMTLRRMDRANITVHGFRSTFRDWVSEETEFQGEVAEAALAHAVSNKVEAAYRRGDLFEKRRRLMAAWGRYCVKG